MFEFVIDQRLSGYDLATVEGRVGALRSAAEVVAGIRDDIIRAEYERVLARRLGMAPDEVQRAVRSAARRANARDEEAPRRFAAPVVDGPEDAAAPIERVTMASLPASAALERDAIMGLLQFGHRLERSQFDRAAAQPFRHPALEAVRQVIVGADPARAGWSVEAVSAVREPYRGLAAELLTAQFPARDDEHAVASTRAMARELVRRSIDAEKQELLGAVQRVPADSDGGRAVRVRLRELDAERQLLLDEE